MGTIPTVERGAQLYSAPVVEARRLHYLDQFWSTEPMFSGLLLDLPMVDDAATGTRRQEFAIHNKKGRPVTKPP